MQIRQREKAERIYSRLNKRARIYGLTMELKFVYPGSLYEGGKMFFKHPMAAVLGD